MNVCNSNTTSPWLYQSRGSFTKSCPEYWSAFWRPQPETLAIGWEFSCVLLSAVTMLFRPTSNLLVELGSPNRTPEVWGIQTRVFTSDQSNHCIRHYSKSYSQIANQAVLHIFTSFGHSTPTELQANRPLSCCHHLGHVPCFHKQ